MLADAVGAAGLEGVFEAVISIRDAGVFKPAARVYQLVHDRLGGNPADVPFMSSNRWDVAGAQVFGFETLWVNRAGLPDEYPDMPAGPHRARLERADGRRAVRHKAKQIVIGGSTIGASGAIDG